MSDNFFANFRPDDDEEQKRRAWEALASQGDLAPHRTLANQVQLPEVDVVAERPMRAPDMDFTAPGNEPADFAASAPPAPEYDRTPPEPDLQPGTDAQRSPELPPDAPPLARLGASLQQRDAAPAPPPREYQPPEYHSRDEGQTTWKGTALAALADILLNRGRGVGGVLALGAAGQSPMAKAELDLKRAQAEHLRNPTSDPATLAYKQAMLELQQGREHRMVEQGGARVDLTRQNIENTQHRFDLTREDKGDPNSRFNQTQVSQAGARAGSAAQGRINTEHALNDIVTGDKSQIAGAEAAARIGAGHDLAPITTQDEAEKARQVGYAGNEPKLAYEQSMNPVLADRSNNGIGQGLSVEGLIKDNPDLDFGNPDQMQRAMKTRAINAKTLDQLQAANRARGIFDSMYKTIDDFQKGPKTPEAIYSANKQLESNAIEYGGVMGRIAGASNQEQMRNDIARVPSLANPYALEGVKRLWDAADANIKGNLGTLGVRAHRPSFGQQPTDAQGTPGTAAIDATNPTPSASPAKGDYANYSRDTSDPNNLGKAPVPKIPAAAQRGTNVSPRTVHKPDGTTVIENLSDEEAATLNARPKWRVE
jgi:hypothetical protein